MKLHGRQSFTGIFMHQLLHVAYPCVSLIRHSYGVNARTGINSINTSINTFMQGTPLLKESAVAWNTPEFADFTHGRRMGCKPCTSLFEINFLGWKKNLINKYLKEKTKFSVLIHFPVPVRGLFFVQCLLNSSVKSICKFSSNTGEVEKNFWLYIASEVSWV